jgi:cytochrome b561
MTRIATPAPTPQRYTGPAMLLHWLIALLIFGLFPLGLYMSDLALSPRKIELYAWHKWFGLTVLLLAVLRVLWRATHRAPPLPNSVPRWQQQAAEALHGLLYLLILAIPLSGWALSSAAGVQVVWWGVLPLPELLPKDRALAHALAITHGLLNYTLAALVVMHVAAALKHQFIDRDGVLLRMLPGKHR